MGEGNRIGGEGGNGKLTAVAVARRAVRGRKTLVKSMVLVWWAIEVGG